MSIFTKTLLAAAAAASIATPVMANEIGPWDLRERTAYVYMADGSRKVMHVSDRGAQQLFKRAKAVKPGTIFMWANGKLWMMSGLQMTYRAGNWMSF